MRKLGVYLLTNHRRAAIAALLCALLPSAMIPTGFLVAVIVGLTTLHKGVKAGLMVLAFALLPTICFLIANRAEFFYGYDILTAQCILAFVLAYVLRRGLSWRLTLEVATVIGFLAVIAVHIFIPNVAQMWVDLYQQHLQSFHWPAMFHGVKSETIIEQASVVATGAIVLVGLVGVILQLFLARWWETSIFSPGAFKTEFMRIRAGRWASGILLLATIGLYWKSSWLIDAYPVLLLPFILSGLSIFHRMAAKKKQWFLLVLAVYIALVIEPFFMVMLLAVIGFIDSWVVFRKRLAWLR